MADFPPEADFSDLDAVAEGLAFCAPDSEPIRPLRLLGVGYYSVAVSTASGIVFRLGCTEEVVKRHDKEARLLPWLGPQLSVAVPHPRWRIAPCVAFPYGAIGYAKVAGCAFTEESVHRPPSSRLARDFAALIFSLHEVPVAEAKHLGASSQAERYAYLERVRQNVLPVLAARLAQADYESIATWWESFLADLRMQDFSPTLVHGDLDYTNLLTDEKAERLVAVLDWEHAAIGDPALDFLQLRYFGGAFQEAVMRQYAALSGRLDADAGYRLHQYWQLGVFYGIQMAARRGSEFLLEKQIGRLRERFVPAGD